MPQILEPAPVKRSAGGEEPVPAAECGHSVVVVASAAELEPYRAAWEDLAASALEPNLFYEPWMLLPALDAFGGEAQPFFVLVFEPDPRRRQGPPRLCGFFPLQRRWGYKGLPVHYLTTWIHLYGFLGTPLLRANGAQVCLERFFTWLATGRRGARLVELASVTADGPFQQVMLDTLAQAGRLSYVTEVFHRALYQPRVEAPTYLNQALANKRRKELRRQHKRLAEQGKLEYVTLAGDADPGPWIEDFLRLEASGWKGQQGGAMGTRAADRAFFETIVREGHRCGRLMMLALQLDGQPIAMKCNFAASEGSFAFKIAFDEHYARFSPGVHLELANMELLADWPNVRWMDSCAIPDHFMINRLWMERRTIQTVLVSSGRCPGDLVVSALPMLRWLNRKLRGGVRRLCAMSQGKTQGE